MGLIPLSHCFHGSPGVVCSWLTPPRTNPYSIPGNSAHSLLPKENFSMASSPLRSSLLFPEHLTHCIVTLLLSLTDLSVFQGQDHILFISSSLAPHKRSIGVTQFLFSEWMNAERGNLGEVHAFPVWSIFVTNKPRKAHTLEGWEEIWVCTILLRTAEERDSARNSQWKPQLCCSIQV